MIDLQNGEASATLSERLDATLGKPYGADAIMVCSDTGSTSAIRRLEILEGKTFLICVGAMKAATSWLFYQLLPLPGIALSPLKEVHFFDAKFGNNDLMNVEAFAIKRLAFHLGQPGDPLENLRRRRAFRASVDRLRMIYDDSAYFEHFASLVGPRTRVLADITPAYACIGEDGFRFMRDSCFVQNLKPKLLFIMRDPVDRLWSHIRFLPQLGRDIDPSRDWEDLLSDPSTLARSDYRRTILDMESVFQPDEIIYLFYETLFPEGFFRLCEALGFPETDADVRQRCNTTRWNQPLPEPARIAFKEILAPQYDFCRKRFGSELPPEWQP